MQAKGDDWSANAKGYSNLSQDDNSVVIRPSLQLVKAMNKELPISEATAILDVGCGPGTTTGILIRELGSQIPPSARLVASDFSAGMIDQLVERKKAATDPAWARVEPLIADAQDLASIEDCSMSHVMGSLVYNLVTDSEKAIKAAYRVLKPGGLLCMSTWISGEWLEMMRLAALNVKGNKVPKNLFADFWLSPEGVQKKFEDAGFKDGTFEVHEVFMNVDDPTKHFEGFVRTKNPGALLYVGGYSDDELDRFEKEWIRLVDERHPQSPKLLKGIYIVSTGKKQSA